ncbi:MAG: sensor histidine kinase [Actinomycetota bacterium]
MSPAVASSERLRRTERFISFIRLGVVSFNIAAYLMLAPDSPRRGLATIIIILAAIYAVATVLYQPSREKSFASALATTILDNVLIGVWLYATDGVNSPFYPLFYAEAAASIGRFGLVVGNLSAVGSALIYLVVVAIDGFQGVGYQVATRIAYIFFISAFVSYVVEISRRSERELAEAELETKAYMELDRLRSTFVNNISHELRTPLTAIRGASATLARYPTLDPEESETLIQMIDRQSLRLSELVQDIIDIGLVEQGELKPEIEPTNINPVIDQVIVEMERRYGRRIDFVPMGGDPVVVCDGRKISNALQKILDNAIKFSSAKSPVSVAVTQDTHEVRITVVDQGIGIHADDLESIFERFHQVDASHTRRAGGTGIGLSIARTILEMHGGGIEANSRPGEGSRFILWFPKRNQVSFETAKGSHAPGNARTASEPSPG